MKLPKLWISTYRLVLRTKKIAMRKWDPIIGCGTRVTRTGLTEVIPIGIKIEMIPKSKVGSTTVEMVLTKGHGTGAMVPEMGIAL